MQDMYPWDKAAIKAAALREAADHLGTPQPPYFGAHNPKVIAWLRERADETERAEGAS